MEQADETEATLPSWSPAAAALGAVGLLIGGDAIVLALTIGVVAACVAAGMGRPDRLPSPPAGLLGAANAAGALPEAPPREPRAPEVVGDDRRPGVPSRAAGRVLRDRATQPAVLLRAAVGLLAAGAVASFYLRSIGDNPAGLFADEAEIGLEAYRLLRGEGPGGRLQLFYDHFSYSFLGALPLYATAPFVGLFGLSDFAVRLAAAVWTLGALIVIWATLRRLRWPLGTVGALTFAAAPVVIHLGRVNFGHAPSLFALSAGFYAYVRAREAGRWPWAVAAGAGISLSAYGYAAYYLAAPMLLGAMGLTELVTNRGRWRSYRQLAVVVVAALLGWAPALERALTDPAFLDRWRDKDTQQGPLLSWDRLSVMLDNYPKYFQLDYLFQTGEVGQPGAFITRHSVPGAGLFPWLAGLLVAAGIVQLWRHRRSSQVRFALPWVVVLVLYPLPDLATTSLASAPYTFSVFSTMLFVPFLVGLAGGIGAGAGGADERAMPSSRAGRGAMPGVAAVAIAAAILWTGVSFVRGPYADYPLVSADYWGWQYGPRPAIDAFRERAADYDRFWLDGDFNEAYVFLDFYLVEEPQLRAKAGIGGLERMDLRERQLFAVRRERYDAALEAGEHDLRFARIVDVVRYPSGEIALYLVDVRHANGLSPRSTAR